MSRQESKAAMLNSHEACELLGISYSSLLRYMKNNVIPYYKPGSGKNSRVFFDKEELLNYLRSGKQ